MRGPRLIKGGVEPAPCRRWLATHAPDTLDRFEQLVETARAENDG